MHHVFSLRQTQTIKKIAKFVDLENAKDEARRVPHGCIAWVSDEEDVELVFAFANGQEFHGEDAEEAVDKFITG